MASRRTHQAIAYENYWSKGFNFKVKERFEVDRYETLAISRTLDVARAVYAAAIEEKPAGRFLIRSRPGRVKRQPEGDW